MTVFIIYLDKTVILENFNM